MRLVAMVVVSLALLAGGTARAPVGARADSAFQMNVPVLMYHRIQCADPTTRYAGLFMCPDLFNQHMALLESQGWHTITGDELADDLINQTCPDPKTMVITIDDGALDGYVNGAPILEQHGFRGTFAMVVGKVGDYLTNPGLSKPHFDWDQARDLLARGHGIANHTMWHQDIGVMTASQLDGAVQAAQDELVTQLGFGPRVFVYPSGSVGSTPAYLSSRFALAFTTESGASEASTDPMRSPRLRVDGTETAAAVLKAITAYANPCATTTPQPRVALSPTSANLGYAATGRSSAPASITIKNKGTADLHVGATAIGGTDADQFAISRDACTGATIAPAASCVVQVTFLPLSDGAKSAALVVTSDDRVMPTASAALSGSAGPPLNGTIHVNLVARPASDQAFAFTVSNGGGTFSLADDGTSSSGADLSLPGATYTVSVAQQPGWTLTSLTCDEQATINKLHRKATFNLADSGAVSCTFTETARVPDAAIATESDGPYERPGLVASVATADQTVTQTVGAGASTTLYLALTNGSLARDRFVVRGTIAGGAYQVQFIYRATDVTAAVLAGTYKFRLVPGAQRLLTAVVTASSDLPADAAATVTLRLRSMGTTATSDVVTADISGS